jgi:hypothetical protein
MVHRDDLVLEEKVVIPPVDMVVAVEALDILVVAVEVRTPTHVV